MSNSNKVKEIISAIESLSLMDAVELVKELQEVFGIADMPVGGGVSAPADTQAAAPVEEKTEFKVSFDKIDDAKKISVIKVVRELTGLGLKEAKDLVEQSGERVVLNNAPKNQAEDAKKKLVEAGASAKIS